MSYSNSPPARFFEPKRMSVGGVLSASWRIITQHPILILPHVVSTILRILLGVGAVMSLIALFSGLGAEVTPPTPLSTSPLYSALEYAAFVVTSVFSTVFGGMYPEPTKRVLEGADLEFGEVASHVLRRFFSLLGAAILVFFIPLVGYLSYIIGLFILFEVTGLGLGL